MNFTVRHKKVAEALAAYLWKWHHIATRMSPVKDGWLVEPHEAHTMFFDLCHAFIAGRGSVLITC